MKNTLRTFGIAVLVAVTAFSFTACGDGTGNPGPGGNTDPKVFNFTGITQTMIDNANEGWVIGVYQAGTTKDIVLSDALIGWVDAEYGTFSNRIVAGASNDDIDDDALQQNGPTYSITIPLSSASSYFESNWTGTGTFDIWFISVDLFPEHPDSKYYLYKMENVQVTSAETQVGATALLESALISSLFTGGDDFKTLIISGITFAQIQEGSDFSYIFVFPAGTSAGDVEADMTAYLMSTGPVLYAVAGMDLHQIDDPAFNGSTYTITAPLYLPNTTTRWAGSGTFDVYNIVSDGIRIRNYLAAGVSITSANTPISAASYNLVFDSDAGLPPVGGEVELDTPYETLAGSGMVRKILLLNASMQELYYGYGVDTGFGTINFMMYSEAISSFSPVPFSSYVVQFFVYPSSITSVPPSGLSGDEAIAEYISIESGDTLASLGITDEASFVANISSLLRSFSTDSPLLEMPRSELDNLRRIK
ncbi:MAG: hypothetical protein FWD40_02345 [Treponema sp.]|nr:hypothetical protein [Treponema sp.]